MREKLTVRELRKASERLARELVEEKDLPKYDQLGAYVRAIEILADKFRMNEQEAAEYAPQVMQGAQLFMPVHRA